MEDRGKQTPKGRHENPLPGEISPEEKKVHRKAQEEAEADIQKDAELSSRRSNDDLDEGEKARLGETPEGI